MVASEELIPGDGYNYHKAFEVLQSNPESVTAEQLAASMVTAYNEKYKNNENGWNTLAAIKTSALGGLATALKTFTTATQQATNSDWNLINQARADSTKFKSKFLHDLGNFASNLVSANGLTSSIQTAAGQVIQAIQGSVLVQTEASKAKTTGLSIFLPNNAEEYKDYTDPETEKYFQNHAAFAENDRPSPSDYAV
ncbi:clostripain-related cysteine peptidase [Fortiea contorta]|uniref:clostripain-related cysteine peptidase n=1 Tax=Fortiea contorta TaxID=1892405 RepID=UPI000348B942|nr:clostripain-related cysteine peptidase [Fortiea contorta]